MDVNVRPFTVNFRVERLRFRGGGGDRNFRNGLCDAWDDARFVLAQHLACPSGDQDPPAAREGDRVGHQVDVPFLQMRPVLRRHRASATNPREL